MPEMMHNVLSEKKISTSALYQEPESGYEAC